MDHIIAASSCFGVEIHISSWFTIDCTKYIIDIYYFNRALVQSVTVITAGRYSDRKEQGQDQWYMIIIANFEQL